MKTKPLPHPFCRSNRGLFRIASLFGAALLTVGTGWSGEISSGSATAFAGIYKVAASSDPMFPATDTREYFLDFGKGIQAGKLAGSVAISMRQNPNVKVRIMAWQYFPKQGTMVIGNPYSEGSRNAVVRAAWKMTGGENGVIFQRENYQVVLHRADPNDY